VGRRVVSGTRFYLSKDHFEISSGSQNVTWVFVFQSRRIDSSNIGYREFVSVDDRHAVCCEPDGSQVSSENLPHFNELKGYGQDLGCLREALYGLSQTLSPHFLCWRSGRSPVSQRGRIENEFVDDLVRGRKRRRAVLHTRTGSDKPEQFALLVPVGGDWLPESFEGEFRWLGSIQDGFDDVGREPGEAKKPSNVSVSEAGISCQFSYR
jgi:hypothetical protein